MISHLKKLFLLTAFVAIAAPLFAQPEVKADGSGMLAQLTGFAANTPAKDEADLTAGNYKVVSRNTRKVSEYDATYTKFRLVDSVDSYLIVSAKDRVLNAIFVTYNKQVRDRIVSDAEKAGYTIKKNEEKELMYALGMERLLIYNAVNTNTNKTFYTISVSDLTTVEKVREEAGAH